ncbi:hypothetical protein PHMEG_00013891 [Phytophthora megakarya]|uniref:Uncharacterized protein n=1 Tax=Phytophthora megakarya TaxID=4795 RepID=A0A225W6P5_9STRA|nr:hypothetical protein PHMEG_00013891 [Phytophthora megakarya]
MKFRELQQQIAEVKERLVLFQISPTNVTQSLAKYCVGIKTKATLLNRKMADHYHWMQHLNSLMEAATLLNYAVVWEASQQLAAPIQGLDDLGESHSPITQHEILDERLLAAKLISQQHASKLLEGTAIDSPSFHLSLQFASHGWKVATGLLRNNDLRFMCHRCVPVESTNLAKQVATTLWNSIQRDDIFCVFVPLVLSSTIVHREADCSFSYRVMQLASDKEQQSIATVESNYSEHDAEGQEIAWQISMEAVCDQRLCSLVVDSAGEFSSPSSTPSIKDYLRLQMSNQSMRNMFVFGAHVSILDEGVEILLVGSAQFVFPSCRDPAIDLLQYFASHLPVYESIHLTPLWEC